MALDQKTCALLASFPKQINKATDVCYITEALHTYCLCIGNSEDRFLKLSKNRKGHFSNDQVNSNFAQ